MSKNIVDLLKLEPNLIELLKRDANELELSVEDLISHYIRQKLENLILIDGYVFNLINQELLYRGKIIKLTKKEKQFINYLSLNKQRCINLEELKEEVWKNDNTTKFAIRNIPNKIREKTCKNLIINKSGFGYCLNCM